MSDSFIICAATTVVTTATFVTKVVTCTFRDEKQQLVTKKTPNHLLCDKIPDVCFKVAVVTKVIIVPAYVIFFRNIIFLFVGSTSSHVDAWSMKI